MKILIAEDEQVMQDMLHDFLEIFGYEIHIVENGMKAWELWQKENFDIVISDINMPIMSGIDLLRKIKRTAPDFPVILITGVNMDQAKKEAHNYKADAFLIKPFKMKELIDVIKTLTS